MNENLRRRRSRRRLQCLAPAAAVSPGFPLLSLPDAGAPALPVLELRAPRRRGSRDVRLQRGPHRRARSGVAAGNRGPRLLSDRGWRKARPCGERVDCGLRDWDWARFYAEPRRGVQTRSERHAGSDPLTSADLNRRPRRPSSRRSVRRRTPRRPPLQSSAAREPGFRHGNRNGQQRQQEEERRRQEGRGQKRGQVLLRQVPIRVHDLHDAEEQRRRLSPAPRSGSVPQRALQNCQSACQ